LSSRAEDYVVDRLEGETFVIQTPLIVCVFVSHSLAHIQNIFERRLHIITIAIATLFMPLFGAQLKSEVF
jgi:hypothetical protein